jgi:hypothetical protein
VAAKSIFLRIWPLSSPKLGLKRFVFLRGWLEAGTALYDYIRLLNKNSLWIRLVSAARRDSTPRCCCKRSISASQPVSNSAKTKDKSDSPLSAARSDSTTQTQKAQRMSENGCRCCRRCKNCAAAKGAFQHLSQSAKIKDKSDSPLSAARRDSTPQTQRAQRIRN